MKAHINQQTARPLALLYGLPESTETGRGVRAALEEQYQLVSYDHNGTVGKRRTRSSSS